MLSTVGAAVWVVSVGLFGHCLMILMGLVANPVDLVKLYFSSPPRAADLYRGRHKFVPGAGQYRPTGVRA